MMNLKRKQDQEKIREKARLQRLEDEKKKRKQFLRNQMRQEK